MKTEATTTAAPELQLESARIAAENAQKALKQAREAVSKAKAEAREALQREREARVNKPTATGSTIKILCKTPDSSFEDVVKQLTGLGIDPDKQMSSVRTTYAYVRQIVANLRENGLMK